MTLEEAWGIAALVAQRNEAVMVHRLATSESDPDDGLRAWIADWLVRNAGTDEDGNSQLRLTDANLHEALARAAACVLDDLASTAAAVIAGVDAELAALTALTAEGGHGDA